MSGRQQRVMVQPIVSHTQLYLSIYSLISDTRLFRMSFLKTSSRLDCCQNISDRTYNMTIVSVSETKNSNMAIRQP